MEDVQSPRDENDLAADDSFREALRENRVSLSIGIVRPPESDSQLFECHVDDATKLARQIADSLFTCRSYCDSIVGIDFRGIHYGVSDQDQWNIQFYLQEAVNAALALNKYLRGGLKNRFLLAYPQAATKTIGGVSSGSAHNLMVALALDIVSKAWSVIHLDETGNKYPFHAGMIFTFGFLVTMEEEDPEKRPVFRQRHVEGVAGAICSYPVLDKDEINAWLDWEAGKVKETLPTSPNAEASLQSEPPVVGASDSGETSENETIEHAEDSKLRPAIEKAWLSWKLAEEKNPGKFEDWKAYKWLKKEEFDAPLAGYELPAFDTWQRQLRDARRYYGKQKNQPRAGRAAGPSVVKQNEI